jgi:GT2 family glycosyltransferase
LVYGDGRFQHSAFAFPGLIQLACDLFTVPARLYESPLNGRYPRRLYNGRQLPFPVDHPLGAAMLVRRDVAEATNGFDEALHMYCEEVDWCWRIRRAGWTILTVPAAEIVHFGGESTKQAPASSILNLWRSRALLYQRHHGRLTQLVARRLVQARLKRRATRVTNEELRRAYLQAAEAWGGQRWGAADRTRE